MADSSRTIVLHGLWWQSRFHLWGEYGLALPGMADQPAADEPPRARRERRLHPAAVEATELHAILGETCPDGLLASSADDSLLVLRLPCVDGVPLPSGQRAIGDRRSVFSRMGSAGSSPAAAPPAEPTLLPLAVPALSFSPADAIDLLVAVPPARPLQQRGSAAGSAEPWLAGNHAAQRLVYADSLRYWQRLARMILSLLARRQFVPDVEARPDGRHAGRWRIFVRDRHELAWLERYAAAMPPVCREVVGLAGSEASSDAAESGVVSVRDRPLSNAADSVWTVDDFLLTTTDALVRRTLSNDPFFKQIHRRAAEEGSWELQWLSSLVGRDNTIHASPEDNATRAGQVHAWIGRIEKEKRDRPPAVGFMLLEPDSAADAEAAKWHVRCELRSEADGRPLEVASVWAEGDRSPTILGRHLFNRREHLLAELARAGDTFPMLGDLLKRSPSPSTEPNAPVPPPPTDVELTTSQAYAFITEWGPMLRAQGFGLNVPAWAERSDRRLGMELYVRPFEEPGQQSDVGISGLGLSTMLTFDWRVAVGDEQLSAAEFKRLATATAPLVNVRGHWMSVDREAAQRAMDFMTHRPGGKMTLAEAIRIAGGAEDLDAGLPIVGLRGASWIDRFLADMSDLRMEPLPQPSDFHGTLRPYQRVGLDWLAFLERLGIGACLADDMGLGKTIQLIALLLHERSEQLLVSAPAASLDETGDAGVQVAGRDSREGGCENPDVHRDSHQREGGCDSDEKLSEAGTGLPGGVDPTHGSVADPTASASPISGCKPMPPGASEAREAVGPTLLFAPMSVVGNWEREISRFAPSLRVLVHHGPERLGGVPFVEATARHDIVITTYGLAQRDFKSFSRVAWHRIALDEAQKIKNPSANQTIAIRSLRARHRVALTGTPVENHLSELWSIMEELNPGLLGSASAFRTRFAIPIEKLGDRERAAQLRRLIRPFVLRRLKSDPKVCCDLPEKMEMHVYCNLTPEQAAHYERIVNSLLREVEAATGIRRRGLILATLTRLKQVCNHPAHLLRDGGPLDGRSGKCERLVEMLEEVLEAGDAALVFTQFREMGELLHRLLVHRLHVPILFLHGGTPVQERNRMIDVFQDPASEERLFLLSLKAGGFGLNLTKANHVFHFDRWWNPAVEEQATDRAHRIGQTRRVQVHKFVCIGTIEDRIDQMLTEKAALADQIVGSGEEWLTGLSTKELREYLRLSQEAVAEE